MASLVVSESRRLVASLLILRQMKYISDFVVFQYYDSEIVKSYVRNSAIDIYDDGFPLIPEEIPLVLGITPIGGSPFGLVLRTEPVWLSMTESCARNMAFSQYSCILASRRFPLSLAQASQAAMTSSDCLVRVAISSWRLWRIAWCLFRDLAALCRFRSFLLRSMSSCSSSYGYKRREEKFSILFQVLTRAHAETHGHLPRHCRSGAFEISYSLWNLDRLLL